MSKLDPELLELAADVLSTRDGDDGVWLSGAEIMCVVRWLRAVEGTARGFRRTIADARAAGATTPDDAFDFLLNDDDHAAQELAELVTESLRATLAPGDGVELLLKSPREEES